MEPGSFPEADRPVITALRLPERYLITGEDANRPESFLLRLQGALERGVGMVQLRAHGLPDERYRDLLSACLPCCREQGVGLIINRPDRTVEWLGEADGIHFTARQLMGLSRRPPGNGLIGASCHNPEELAQAAQLELDYALLSPVAPTASHPQHTHLGWSLFSEWVDRVNLPVYALGGMRSDSLSRAIRAGAQGIAGISTFWRLNR
jgi:8-oxo-dGTP diphosphatase